MIEADGSVSNAQVLRGIGGGLDEVAREAVMKMPGWKPGKKDGVAVPV
ncbi:MAG TPA: energy transducer TonB, partial [Bacteroidales bacterium]|nr:energy transducer TonB [Bacteroidales bacterium]